VVDATAAPQAVLTSPAAAGSPVGGVDEVHVEQERELVPRLEMVVAAAGLDEKPLARLERQEGE